MENQLGGKHRVTQPTSFHPPLRPSLTPSPVLRQLADDGARRDAAAVVGEDLGVGGPTAEVLWNQRDLKMISFSFLLSSSSSYRRAGTVGVHSLDAQVNQVRAEQRLCSDLRKQRQRALQAFTLTKTV